MLRKIIETSNKIVIKIGSNVLSDETPEISKSKIREIINLSTSLISLNKKIVIVSSGAMLAGKGLVKLAGKEDDIKMKQALSAIGQVKLMQSYREGFLEHYIPVGQILLSTDDLSDKKRKENILNTIESLILENVVPIINENDAVSTDEITFGDNDILSAEVSKLFNADLLLMISDTPGVYEKLTDEEPLRKISKSDLSKIEIGDIGGKGKGGIKSKLDAGKIMLENNKKMFLFSGKEKILLENIYKGKGTLFSEDS